MKIARRFQRRVKPEELESRPGGTPETSLGGKCDRARLDPSAWHSSQPGAAVPTRAQAAPEHYFFISGADIGGAAFRLAFTVSGSLSEFASSRLTCQICVVESDF